jgi:fructose-bisphosphate aldolase class II
MPLVASAELLQAAVSGGYAVPHFNVCNLETVLAVADVADELRSPVIFGIHPVESGYAGMGNMVAMITSVMRSRDIHASIHLDHSPTFDQVIKAIRAGYTSVMYDGSMIPLPDNIRITRDVVRAAKPAGVSVEAEVGTIGNTAEYGGDIENPHLADPAACEAMSDTGIDALAVAIGNAHGVYIAEPALDFDLLAEIRRRTDVPLVLHGGTGIPKDQVQKSIAMGVAKMNIGTAVHVAFKKGMQKCMAEDPGSHDIMKILRAAQASVRDTVRDQIDMTMSANRC